MVALCVALAACTAPPADERRAPPDPVVPSAPAPSPTVTSASPSPRTAAAEPLPTPDEPIPKGPAEIAAALTDTTQRLHAAIDRWRHEGDPARPGIPEDVELLALYQQRITRGLAREADRWRRVRPLLPGWLRGEVIANVRAAAELLAIITPIEGDAPFETAPPPPAGELLRSFKEGERRFGVDWEVLAAVCYIESKFARVKAASTAGAQGPMQFLPSTWEVYGMGGDINDPHDAILGAANYLHASGAPADDAAALFAYNHSDAYVDAILRHAGQIRDDPNDYFAYYAWQVFVVTTDGDRRLTGPGL
ncbi:MAG TPA: transglycosylase SLT domain-containing protein [Actinomycetota bacterium]|nr:transglycosylase SLT domain-containing protein [Actinomycetota bacterium]